MVACMCVVCVCVFVCGGCVFVGFEKLNNTTAKETRLRDPALVFAHHEHQRAFAPQPPIPARNSGASGCMSRTSGSSRSMTTHAPPRTTSAMSTNVKSSLWLVVVTSRLHVWRLVDPDPQTGFFDGSYGHSYPPYGIRLPPYQNTIGEREPSIWAGPLELNLHSYAVGAR